MTTPAPTGASLDIRGLTKSYAGKKATDSIDLEIKAGEFVTLLGASGSGKTTLLRIVAGFLDSDEGSLLMDGRELGPVPVHKRDIGMVFQSYALFPHLSVAQNVAYPLLMRRVSSKARTLRVAEVLEAVRLPEYGNRRVSELSGGQQQRVALARAIVSRPRLLLMDEPLGALDRNLRDTLQLEISRLSRELGLTVVNVTHDQEEALTMSDRIALLDQGALVQYATPDDLYHRPVDDLAASFVGESNIFRGATGENGTLTVADGIVYAPPTLTDGSAVATDPVAVVVRPTLVGISAPGTAPESHSRVEAIVSGTVNAGGSRKVIALSRTGQELIARQDASKSPSIAVGEAVVFHWDPRESIATSLRAAQ
jgi:putative spermidine/putrescine transport system ATP-binding protein